MTIRNIIVCSCNRYRPTIVLRSKPTVPANVGYFNFWGVIAAGDVLMEISQAIAINRPIVIAYI